MPADKSLKDLSGAVYKIAENSPKIQKDVKDIRDAVCGTEGILESLYILNKKLDKVQKKETLAKLTGKKSDPGIGSRNIIKNTNSIATLLGKILNRVERISSKSGSSRDGRRRLHAENFRREDERGNRKIKSLESISRSIDIVERLRSINLKDFIFTKKKMKHLSKIMMRSLNLFRNFKNQKEAEATISFINSSIDIVKKLGKVWIISKPAQWGAKAIEKIFLGGKKPGGGLLGLFRKLSANKRHIDRGKRTIKDILKSCGSFLLTSIILVGIAAVSVPAMLGALLMKGVIWLLVGTYKFLSKSARTVVKGSFVLLMMSASIITFGLGLAVMSKAVRNMKLKDVGIMVASLAGIGLTVAGIGLLAVPIALGSATLLLMGVSLGVFALALNAWNKIDTKKSMGNIKEAIGGLREVFGIELGKADEKKSFGQRLGGGIMDIAMGVLNFGKTFFIMGSLLLAGAALGLLYHGLKNWDNFNGAKAAKNIKVAVGALKEAFGIEDKQGGIKEKLKGLGGGILDMGISLLQSGKALAQMGTITIATGMSDMIRLFLIPWNNYNASKAIGNMKVAIDGLKGLFGLEDKQEGIKEKLKGLGGGILDMGTALLQSGKTLAQMGTITIATGMSDLIRVFLIPWNNYNASKAIGNMSIAVNGLKELFGLEDNNDNIGGKGLKLVGNILDMGTTLFHAGGVLAKMGTITIATGMLDVIKKFLVPWEDYNASKAIGNIKITVENLLDVFGLGKISQPESDNSVLGKAKSVLKAIGDVVTAPFKIASSLAETAATLAQGGSTMAKLSNVLHATSALFSIKGSLEIWDNYNSDNALKNIKKGIVNVGDLFKEIEQVRSLDKMKISTALYFEASSKSISNGLTSLVNAWKKSETLKSTEVPFKKTVDNINALDITKATTMIELFKSFSNIKKKPFDKFTEAVNKFAESSTDLIDALNNFSNNYNPEVSETSTEYTNQENTNVSGGIDIKNPQALADAIASAIKSIPINVETNISDIKLVVNGESGRRVILSLDN